MFKKIFRINGLKHSIPIGIEIALFVSYVEGKQVKSKKRIKIRLASECRGGLHERGGNIKLGCLYYYDNCRTLCIIDVE
jgi:hypothetical protein